MSEKPGQAAESALSPMQKAFLQTIDSLASKRDREVFVVGGLVRDLFLGATSSISDIDLVLENDTEAFAQEVAKMLRGNLRKHPAFLTYKIEHPEAFPSISEFDLATARTETYACPGALPSISASTIHDDLSRRDFSINALAVKLSDLVSACYKKGNIRDLLKEHILDFFSGLKDLDKKLVRVLHDESFIDDPTRIFRACRYAARIDGTIEAHTLELLKESIKKGALQTISWFRVLNELRKALSERQPQKVFSNFDDCGLLEVLPCVSPDRAVELRNSLLLLARPLKKRRESLFGVLLRLLVYFADDEVEPSIFRAASLSKEIRAAILRDVEVIRAGRPIRTSSDEILLMGAALEKDESRRAEYEAALKKRGLVD